ncbi:MAG: SRPBCC family protein, partial [Haloechinothrix sp.]
MQLANRFEVPVPVDQAWEVLLDVPRVARCLPGATLDERDGDTYHGQVKLKIGSITASYRGQATVSAADPSQRTALVTASGREQRGGGRASAEVRVRLFPDGERTRVEVVTELSI